MIIRRLNRSNCAKLKIKSRTEKTRRAKRMSHWTLIGIDGGIYLHRLWCGQSQQITLGKGEEFILLPTQNYST